MADQILKDRMNRKIGVIKTDSRGVQTIYDKLNRKLGSYDPKTDVTKDRLNRKIGKGNLLVTLLEL